jgi:hypothetical protein
VVTDPHTWKSLCKTQSENTGTPGRPF